MKRFFDNIRWIAALLLIIPTFIIIVAGGIISSTSKTISAPENPKKWLSNGNAYENAVEVGVNEVLRQIKKESNDVSISEITRGAVDEEEIKDIANNVFTPEWIQEQSENIIDSAYSFLHGEKNTIEFTIDLTQVNDNAEQEITALFIEIAESLPTCSSNENISLEELSLLEAECLPPNVSISDIETAVQNEIDTIPYFQKDQISSEELGLQFEKASTIQYIFEIIQSAPLIFIFITLLLSFIIFLLVPKLRSKLKTIGYLWGLSGLTIVVLSFLAKISFSSFILDFIIERLPQENSALFLLLKSPIQAAYADITADFITLGFILLAIGLIFAISSLFIKRK